MKKIFIILLITCVCITGCSSSKNAKKEIIKNFDKKNSYKLKGSLSINNNDDVYNYNVEVGYKKDRYYKVVLINKANGHKQVILKNDDGVYVLTPSLNKSFKFQSDWPYDNSQVYLLNALGNDISNDTDSSVVKKNDKYFITTKVNYANNSKLVKQNLEFSKNLELNKVVVYDKDGVEVMTMKFDSIKFTDKFSKDYFSVDSIINVENSNNENTESTKETSSLEDTLYPLVLPSGTKLINEEKVSKDKGERVIMTYEGEKNFLLVEETADVFSEFTVIPSSGEPFQLLDTLGVMGDNSLSWTRGNTEYYIVSEDLSKDEMLDVASSIGTVTSLK